ncbi:MAG TPA: hypothetical protein VF690_08830 [Hymenobacter sp.]
MPILHAEVQVVGARARCTLSQHSLHQRINAFGRPSSTVCVGLMKLTFSGKKH